MRAVNGWLFSLGSASLLLASSSGAESVGDGQKLLLAGKSLDVAGAP
ncbi:MAG TPA: hypothetical protein VGI93_14000 [Steroidobacteraceae bacterium]|jgi:hypothetical protein